MAEPTEQEQAAAAAKAKEEAEAAKAKADAAAGLGDAGKKALDEERSGRKSAEKAAKDAQAELDKLKASSMTDQEKAVAAARAEGRAEALKLATERLLKAEVRAAASGKLADPDDAIHLLDPSKLTDANGDIDPKAIASEIDVLVKAKPYLSPSPGNGSGEGGPRGTTSTSKSPSQTMDEWMRSAASGKQ